MKLYILFDQWLQIVLAGFTDPATCELARRAWQYWSDNLGSAVCVLTYSI